MPNQGYFVIADITGYTIFLTGSELDHAQEILKSLFDTLLENIKPPLMLSNFQGDAILTYAPEGGFLLGQTLLDTVDNVYSAFARKLELMQHNTTCTCRACANMGKLDLKLFIHYGEYVVQDLRGRAELSGSDVIIAHRMMKNQVREKTGYQAYALFTKAAIDRLEMQGVAADMTPHSESYEHIGEVPMYVYDLSAMWARERDQRREEVQPQGAWMVLETDVRAPAPIVWDCFNEPERRRRLLGAIGVTVSGVKNGRMGVGTVHHCAHGAAMTVDMLILDWRPFEYMTMLSTGIDMGLTGRFTMRLTPTATGTHVTLSSSELKTDHPLFRAVIPLIRPLLKKKYADGFRRMLDQMHHVIEEDVASGAINVFTAEDTAIPEKPFEQPLSPALPSQAEEGSSGS